MSLESLMSTRCQLLMANWVSRATRTTRNRVFRNRMAASFGEIGCGVQRRLSSLRANRSNPERPRRQTGLLRRYAPRNDEAGSPHLLLEFGKQGVDMGEAAALAGEDGAEGVALQRGDQRGRQPLARRDRAVDDVDQPVGAVQAAPEIVVLAIGAAEESAEAVELDALERRRGAALADRGRVLGRDAVDL